MSIITSPLLLGADSGIYQISRSLRYDSSASSYLNRSPASSGNRKTFTFSCWMKRGKFGSVVSLIGVGTDSVNLDAFDLQDECLRYTRSTSGSFITLKTTAVFRDPSAWYHVLLAIDTTQATAANRARIYVNGAEITTFSSASYPSQNEDTFFNTTNAHTIGRRNITQSDYFDGYLADIHYLDGIAADPSSFAETNAITGQWVPKAFTGSYGTNGFRLAFDSYATTAALGTDTSGNGNTWTVNNLSVTAGSGNDSLVDTPTSYGTDTGAGGEVRGNYCTWNPLKIVSGATLTNGNLDYTHPATGSIASTLAVSSGKWYWEVTLTAGRTCVGLVATTANIASGYPGYTIDGWGYFSINGYKVNNYPSTYASYGASFTTGDVIGVAFDADAGTLTFYKNGSTQGQAFSGITGSSYQPAVGGDNGTTGGGTLNAGQRAFAYTAPSGFKALCDTNLPTPVVAKGSAAMDVLTWSGNNASPRSFTGLNFSPDFVWAKCRSDSAGHSLYDAVRGTANELQSQSTQAEFANSIYGYINSFDSNGFTVVAGTDPTYGSGSFNMSGRTYVGWAWDAGTSTVTNTAGSITSQVRANASAGFSVVTWTSPSSGDYTIGHGLGVAPSLVITKSRSAGGDQWYTFHRSVCTSTSNYLKLSSTDGLSTFAGAWGATLPTSTVVGLNAGGGFIPSSATAVAYCFAPVSGYSSFGSYTGNGSADGPFVYTGFRPRWVLLKQSSGSGTGWQIHDTSRNTYNVMNNRLQPNNSDAESTYTTSDFLSNGFKLRDSDASWNSSGATYIYAAFAESPFQFSRAR